jgi:hypothetical protein
MEGMLRPSKPGKQLHFVHHRATTKTPSTFLENELNPNSNSRIQKLKFTNSEIQIHQFASSGIQKFPMKPEGSGEVKTPRNPKEAKMADFGGEFL